MRLAALMLVAATPATAGAPARPSVGAAALADAMLPSTSASEADRKDTEDLLFNMLGSRLNEAFLPGGCDMAVDACRDAARRIAREEAPVMMELVRKASVLAYAWRFDRELDPQQLAAANAFFRTPEGQALARSLSLQGERRRDADAHSRDKARAGRAADPLGRVLTLQKRFRAETADLPKYKSPIDFQTPPPPELKE
jgi:hypothetical protein